METLKKILEYEIFGVGDYKIKVITVSTIILILIITNIILWLIQKALFRKHLDGKNEVEIGNTHAVFQIIKYIVWILSISFILESIGLKVTVLIAGSAALLVGVGLGLQRTFNDIISGIILLSERTIRIGDILEIDDDIVIIQKIGLRTSIGIDRDEITIIIPNSLITNNKVINWSHQSKKTRFKIDVGVAYGTDIKKVIKVLQESTLEHPEISDKNMIEIRLTDFGNSSIDFQILFFSRNIFRIERVKSDIRQIIMQKFLENNITIPFPQTDIHFKTSNVNF